MLHYLLIISTSVSLDEGVCPLFGQIIESTTNIDGLYNYNINITMCYNRFVYVFDHFNVYNIYDHFNVKGRYIKFINYLYNTIKSTHPSTVSPLFSTRDGRSKTITRNQWPLK